MSTPDIEFPEDELQTPDELTTLKARADLLQVSYHPSIGLEKLREKINAKLAEGEGEAPAEAKAAPAEQETEAQKRLRLKREALKLIRVRITCMNPVKKEWEGEIITVSNNAVGTVKRYVPFNADDGWHLEHILLEQLRERQCQVFYTAKDDRGNKIRKGKLIKEFAIEVLDPLTEAELKELAQRQAMAKSV